MEDKATRSPRDSRMEQFATTARNIIMIERGLTATALTKIRHLAKQQHLSNEQVESCLSQISGGGNSLGRVGRYEQLFLDRMAIDLPTISNAESSGVLPPMIERVTVRMAVDEFQISERRANQLLSFAAKKHGLRRVSAADAKAKLRDSIASRLDSRGLLPAELASEISVLAERFGIGRSEVEELIEGERIARQKQRSQRRHWLFLGSLIAACLAVAAWYLGSTFFSSSLPDDFTISESATSKSEIEPSTVAGDEEQPLADGVTPQTSDQPQDPNFDIGEFDLSLDDSSVEELKNWQRSLIEVSNQPLDKSERKQPAASLADRRKKDEAIAKLQADVTDSRNQVRGLEDLSDLTKTLPDITAAEARLLAQFCLQADFPELQMAVQRKIDRLKRWPRFLLAISDQLADQSANKLTDENQRPSEQQWQQRLALLLVNGKLENSNRLSDAIFEIASLRLKENALSQQQQGVAVVLKSEQSLVSLVRQFATSELSDPFEQRYFNRLIANRDRTALPMQRRLELQQILIETILLANADTKALVTAESYLRKIQTANTIGEQLVESRQTLLKLSAMYLAMRQQSSELDSLQVSKTQPFTTMKDARQLRDLAELAAISEDRSQIATAIQDYRTAAGCGDSGVTRSCLRGLIAITTDTQEKRRYRRQLDFVSGGQMGPCDKSAAAKNAPATEADLRGVIEFCQKIRRQEKNKPPEEKAPGNAFKNWHPSTKTFGAVLTAISDQPRPLATTELALVVQIESAAKLAVATAQELRFEIELPWQMQALIPPVEVTPLMPLQW